MASCVLLTSDIYLVEKLPIYKTQFTPSPVSLGGSRVPPLLQAAVSDSHRLLLRRPGPQSGNQIQQNFPPARTVKR